MSHRRRMSGAARLLVVLSVLLLGTRAKKDNTLLKQDANVAALLVPSSVDPSGVTYEAQGY